jgi:hypothetical protein
MMYWSEKLLLVDESSLEVIAGCILNEF